MTSALIQDIRYALRQLRRTPVFTITAILTLALGIGANAAIFTLVHAVLMKNLPVTDPKTLVRIGDNDDCCVNSGTIEDGDYALFPTATYQLLRKNAPEFEDLAAMQAGFEYRPVIVRREGTRSAQSVMEEFVSGNYFRAFGLQPERGRLLTDSDDVQGAPMMAVMSYRAWQRDFAGDPSVVGSTFWINTKPVAIAGIAPQGFFGDRIAPEPPDFYLPIETMPVVSNATYVHDPTTLWLYLIGRVKRGTNMAVLQQKLSALVKQSFAETTIFCQGPGKRELAKVHVVLTPGGAGIQSLREEYESNLWTLSALSGFVLLIACANIANLLLVRGMARKPEMSVRTAVGAMRGRIARQLLTESVVLAGLGGIAGLVVAYAGTRLLLSLAFPGEQNIPIHADPTPPVLAFACGLSLLTGILFGVAPAWTASHADPTDALRSCGRSTATGSSMLQRSLVVLQAALSLILLVGAGLFAQSLNNLQNSDLKLQTRNRYIIHINPQAAGYSQTQLEALYRLMEDRFHAVPGVAKVGISLYTPMEDDNWSTSVQVQGLPDPKLDASMVRASPEYFDSVGTHIVTGRGINEKDTSTSQPVAVVNEEFVRELFKGQNPIGHHFGSPGPTSPADFEIVGVVENTTYSSVRWKNHKMFFLPLMQRAPSDKDPIDTDQSLYAGAIVLATTHPLNDMESIARDTLSGINPNLTVVKFQAFDQQVADRFSSDRMVARLTMLFGVVALLLATVGLYGVTSYTVARRTCEIGIRMALGAERSGVIAMVMRGAMIQAAIGLAIGIPVALSCARFIKSQLYDVAGVNAIVLAASVVTLAVAACVAGLIPARRAASTDPARTLRTE
jgi:macrolide transport system ATP-binding/permease protein